MRILVTGAKGFVGKNLVAQLKNIRDGKARFYPGVKVDEVYEYDIDSSPADLDVYCKDADFVFNLAGVNRPKDQAEFMKGNYGFASQLLDALKKHGNKCPVMLSSSIQATLKGRFEGSEYGKSKLAGEKLFFEYSEECGAKVLVYRFSNLFGKWCRPDYNSVVATFCHNIANDLPIKINDPSAQVNLVYIDDLVDELIGALEEKEHHCDFDGVTPVFCPEGKYCGVPISHSVTVGEIASMLRSFADEPKTLTIPQIPEGSFQKKLYSTYVSYLPEAKIAFPLAMHVDQRGSFTELVKTISGGQVSINITKPRHAKGRHWHNSKWEFFIVVAGHGLIREREIGTDKVIEFEVSGDNVQAVHMLPGYTHEFINLSDTEDLVTVIWANEQFNPDRPDTFAEEV
ncbi:MAG: NAD-dependent epimerase/dehydratase family protein [Bacteroidales bacterium]|nr:NAD-dependent epimerase/dehydratase family protein [Bacteroidales bacterium]MDY2935728.1 NAD-dependent epimerase/dehydratase family protein [Candidatus Cryptobacteroides sp.]